MFPVSKRWRITRLCALEGRKILRAFHGNVNLYSPGAGGLINASNQMNAVIHNTLWVTGHFHLTVATRIWIDLSVLLILIAYTIPLMDMIMSPAPGSKVFITW